MTTKENIKANAAAIYEALGDAWPSVLVKKDDGTIDLNASRRAVLGALSIHLRAVGILKTHGRQVGFRPKPKDMANIHNAIYFAFVSHAKAGGISLPALLNATAVMLAVPYEDFERAKRDIRRALDTHPLLQTHSTNRKFDGVVVTPKAELKGELVNPKPFSKWGEPPPPEKARPVELGGTHTAPARGRPKNGKAAHAS